MKYLKNFFVHKKYSKIRDRIFRLFIISVLVTGILFYFTDYTTPAIIVGILFTIYEIPHLLFNSYDTAFKKKN